MNGLIAFLACVVCKATHGLLRLLNKGATALPGRLALAICPDLLAVLAKKVNTVVVTGTNGKTTVSRMVETAFKKAGIEAFANRSGSNLRFGIAAEFVMNTNLFGRPRCKWAVIECDEAASRRVLGELCPRVAVVTNLFRDQLDRYGEITATKRSIAEGLKKTPGTLLCLNADCSITASLALEVENKVRYFGLGRGAANGAAVPESSDAPRCLRCGERYEYGYVTYAHLGGFYCPKCGYRRQQAQVEVTDIIDRGADVSRVVMSIDAKRYFAQIRLPALYNIYNAASAVAAVTGAGLSPEAAIAAASDFDCGFGRMERFPLGERGAQLILIKNPAACDSALAYLRTVREAFTLVMCLNDRTADGRDVSWIWDAGLERLASMQLLEQVIVSGDRAADMALRLKYAGVPPEKVSVMRRYKSIVSLLGAQKRAIYILPTYTAMLEMRSELVRRCGGSSFWE